MCGTWAAGDDTLVVGVLGDCSVLGTLDHTVAVACSCAQGLTGYQVCYSSWYCNTVVDILMNYLAVRDHRLGLESQEGFLGSGISHADGSYSMIIWTLVSVQRDMFFFLSWHICIIAANTRWLNKITCFSGTCLRHPEHLLRKLLCSIEFFLQYFCKSRAIEYRTLQLAGYRITCGWYFLYT